MEECKHWFAYPDAMDKFTLEKFHISLTDSDARCIHCGKLWMDNLDWSEVFENVYDSARGRHGNRLIRNLDDEINFIMGAGSMLFALGYGRKLPASWVFGIMGGKSPSGIEYEEPKKKRKTQSN